MNNKNMNLKYKNVWLFIGLCMVIFVIKSSLESDPIILDLDFKMQDKVLHITGYFGLMGWFMQIYQQKKMRYLLAVIFVSMGVSLEYLQYFGGLRHFEVNDMLANSAGVFLAWSLMRTPFPKMLFWFEEKLLR